MSFALSLSSVVNVTRSRRCSHLYTFRVQPARPLVKTRVFFKKCENQNLRNAQTWSHPHMLPSVALGPAQNPITERVISTLSLGHLNTFC